MLDSNFAGTSTSDLLHTVGVSWNEKGREIAGSRRPLTRHSRVSLPVSAAVRPDSDSVKEKDLRVEALAI